MRRAQQWQGETVAAWQLRWGVPRLRVYHEIGSTNTLALRLAERGAAHGTTIIADAQTAGRGRRGRRWHAPAGSALLLSMIVRASEGGRHPGAAPVRVGAIVARCIEAVTGLAACIKWPNDVLAPSGAKLGGILCEGAWRDDGSGYIVAGIGVNVTQEREDFSADLREQATSLLMVTGASVSRARLADAIVRALLAQPDIASPLTRSERTGLDALHLLHRAEVSVDDVAAGRVLGILPDGSLAILGPHGPGVVRHGTLRRSAAGPGRRRPGEPSPR